MSISQLIRADGPAAYWPCDDADPATLRELVAGRNAAKVGSGQVALQQLGPMRGVKVVGAYGYQFTPATALLSGPYTVECWAKFDAFVNADISSIFAIAGTTDWRRFVRVGQGTASLAFADAGQTDGPSAAPAYTSGAGSLAINTLYHLACTYDTSGANTGRWYINGELATSTAVTNVTPANVTSQNGWLLGGWAGSSSTWPTFGTFAHIAAYTRALSASEIKAHYRAGLRERVSY